MTPTAFITKWHAANLKERSASQEHFLDLCRVLGEPTLAEADPTGDWYCFERGVSKLAGSNGWADVWKRGCFGWEYKSRHQDLHAAYVQLQQYAVALENPPLLIVCDLERFRIHTNWTNTVQQVYDLTLEDLHDPDKRQLLKWAFSDPERLKPGKTRQRLTEDATDQFARLALQLRTRGEDAQAVAHFINRLVFCMFAEDVGLLPNGMFTRMLEQAVARPAEFVGMAHDLFRAMQSGGRVGFEAVAWFNGGLFDTPEALPLDQTAVELVLAAARLDWSDIDPSIFGTLFERGLDPDKRSQLGAHYTDREKIMLLIKPVLLRPLSAEWEGIKHQIALQMDTFHTATAARTLNRAYDAARALHNRFLERLWQIRVLDPACGSGNFLYLVLLTLKDLEHKTNLDTEALGLERQFPSVGPECVRGIEINPYAAELARVTVWIGEIQWMRRNGFDIGRSPILRPLDTIECRDAILTAEGTEPVWPAVEVIVGNPPFLGGSKMRGVLGDTYVETLRTVYVGRVPGGADLVTYWFEKAREALEQGQTARAGLVATNSIRGGANRVVLEHIKGSGEIVEAWADEPWMVDGAAVRVSLVCFTGKERAADFPYRWDGQAVDVIHADLTAGQKDIADVTKAAILSENLSICFMGASKKAPLDIDGVLARAWLSMPVNPNGKKNTWVLKPLWNAKDVTQRPRDRWVIDFGIEMHLEEAMLFEAPFQYAATYVQPVRLRTRDDPVRKHWWRFGRPRIEMREAISHLTRYIATPAVAKHRLFVWIEQGVLPDQALLAFARDDDTTFGILHSRFHELWTLRLCTWLGKGNDPRYTPTTTFETFPFPAGLTPDIPAVAYAADPRAQRIAEAAKRLDNLRNQWLNPPDLVTRQPEVVAGYPDRLLPKNEAAATLLKQRTLTNLYNERPVWLQHAHRAVDAAVAEAYGWAPDLPDEDVLRRLLALNHARADTESLPRADAAHSKQEALSPLNQS